MLSGDNGILTKATESKEWTERSKIIEIAQMDILGKQAENHRSLSEQELIDILTSNDYNTKGTLSDNNEESVLQKTLISNNGKYQIPVLEIYNGTISEGNQLSDLEKLNEFYQKGWDVITCANEDSPAGGYNSGIEPIPDADTSIKDLTYGYIAYRGKIYKIDPSTLIVKEPEVEYSQQFVTIVTTGTPSLSLGPNTYMMEPRVYQVNWETGEVDELFM